MLFNIKKGIICLSAFLKSRTCPRIAGYVGGVIPFALEDGLAAYRRRRRIATE
jgi:hypothetical protein